MIREITLYSATFHLLHYVVTHWNVTKSWQLMLYHAVTLKKREENWKEKGFEKNFILLSMFYLLNNSAKFFNYIYWYKILNFHIKLIFVFNCPNCFVGDSQICLISTLNPYFLKCYIYHDVINENVILFSVISLTGYSKIR